MNNTANGIKFRLEPRRPERALHEIGMFLESIDESLEIIAEHFREKDELTPEQKEMRRLYKEKLKKGLINE